MKTDVPYEEFIRDLESDPRRLVAVERPRPHCAVVRLDDPENHNALSGVLTVQLRRALAETLADPEIRSVVLTGTDPMLSVGGDWKLMRDRGHSAIERAEGNVGIWKWIRYQFGGVARLIAHSDKPVVVAVNGPVAGVALAWTLNSDLVIASERAQLVLAFGRIGLVPEVGTNWALTRRVGYQKAFELFVRGGVIDAGKALELGLVNEVVPHDRLLPRAVELAQSIATTVPETLRRIREIYDIIRDGTGADGIRAELETAGQGLALADPAGLAERRRALMDRGRAQTR